MFVSHSRRPPLPPSPPRPRAVDVDAVTSSNIADVAPPANIQRQPPAGRPRLVSRLVRRTHSPRCLRSRRCCFTAPSPRHAAGLETEAPRWTDRPTACDLRSPASDGDLVVAWPTLLLRPGTGAKYCDEYVCLSVCLSVRSHKHVVLCHFFHGANCLYME